MPRIRQAVPILPCADVAASLAFYTQKLGFRETFRDATPPQYAGIARDGASVHLTSVPGNLARTIGDQTMVRFEAEDIDALYAEIATHPEVIHPNGKLQTKPWGTREFGVLDPNGVCITFFVDA